MSVTDTSAPLDLLDAIEARAREHGERNTHFTARESAADVPARVDDLLTTVAALQASHRHRSEALLTMTRRALNAERLLDATEGTEREEELARQIRATARREGAEAMREECVEALEAMAHAEGVDAERFRLTRGEDSAAEHHHKRAALLEARVTVLGLTLPEVTR